MTQQTQDPRAAEPQPPFPEQGQAHPGSQAVMEPAPDSGAETYQGVGRLTGRIALITGADSGIGRAVALAFAREGADVAIAYLNEHEDAEETRRLVEEAGRTALVLPGDLSEEAQCRQLVEQAVARFGRIDILVNNAAYQGPAAERVEEPHAARAAHLFRPPVPAHFHLLRHPLPHPQAGRGRASTRPIL